MEQEEGQVVVEGAHVVSSWERDGPMGQEDHPCNGDIQTPTQKHIKNPGYLNRY